MKHATDAPAAVDAVPPTQGERYARHALVTGGGSGIGAAIAALFANSGMRVTIAGRSEARLRACASRHRAVRLHVADVTDAAAVGAAVDEAHAIQPLDIVVANAGAADAVPFVRMSLEAWQAALDVNLTGVFSTFKSAVPRLRGRRGTRLVAVASTAGLKGYPYVAAYCAAKHGVVGLVRALAQELATEDITVNAVCPGFTETPLLERSIERIIEATGRDAAAARASLMQNNPQGRLVTPDEVAATVAWLCSPEAAAVNGQAIAVSGGET